MKKFYYLLSTITVIILITVACSKSSFDAGSVAPMQVKNQSDLAQKGGCATIQSGTITNSYGEVITLGFMDNGYNYQSHIYVGEYSPGWNLEMKWNDAWLSNKDCDGDGKLDRPLDENGSQYYFGSGAWLTNHWTNHYINEDGGKCNYEEFIKIVALPVDAIKTDGIWYNSDGTEIGPDIWGQFAIIQDIVNDPCGGFHGKLFGSPVGPGFGKY